MTLWQFYFGWYHGAVYSNLLASGICAGLVWWRAKTHLRRHRARRAEQLARHHQEIKESVAAQLAGHQAEVARMLADRDTR